MNEASIRPLVAECERISACVQTQYQMAAEFIFVVDGSPDASYPVLKDALSHSPVSSQLVQHARNFGSFSAIRTGLSVSRGQFFAFIAADLQDPPDVLLEFLKPLKNDVCDVVVGVRSERNDPEASKFAARTFWWFYRRFIVPDVPKGGIDLFGCNRIFRDALLGLNESHSSLIAQIFWLGFRRSEVSYSRRERQFGKSAWTLRKKLKYFLDSIFAFSDLPIKVLGALGAIGVATSLVMAIVEIYMKMSGHIGLPGFTATIIVILFFGGLNTFGLSIVGLYVWRAYENTKQRPLAIIRSIEHYNAPQSEVHE